MPRGRQLGLRCCGILDAKPTADEIYAGSLNVICDALDCNRASILLSDTRKLFSPTRVADFYLPLARLILIKA
jgi:hypothetical protein